MKRSPFRFKFVHQILANHSVLLAAWIDGMVGGWGAAANKNNHLKRHAIVLRQGSNFLVTFRDCLAFGCVKRERALYPDKNGNNPYEFVVKNRGVGGGETRQKRKENRPFAYNLGCRQVGMSWLKYSPTTPSSLKCKDNFARAAHKKPISVGAMPLIWMVHNL